MMNRKAVYEGHVKQLSQLLSQRSIFLKEKSLTGKKLRLDPQYRQIEGRLIQFRRRLKAIEKMEQLQASKHQS